MRFAAIIAAAGLCAGCVPTDSPDASADDSIVTISIIEPETPEPAGVPLPPVRPKFPQDAQALAMIAKVEETDAGAALAAAAPAPEPPPVVAPKERTLDAYEKKEAAEAEGGDATKGPDGRPLPPAVIRPYAGAPYYAAYPHVKIDCFPDDLRAALVDISAHFKADVQVTSGFRDRGRRGSMHRSCKAADIRVAGVSPSQLAAYARTVGGVNGVGTYRYTSVIHVDTRRERFVWRY